MLRSKKYIDQEPPYPMRQKCVLHWEEIKTKFYPFPSIAMGALGFFTFLPECTVHNMRIYELGVPVDSSLVRSSFIQTMINISNKGQNFSVLILTVVSQQVKYHTVKCTQNLSPQPSVHVLLIYE